jgi:hypothetical protein
LISAAIGPSYRIGLNTVAVAARAVRTKLPQFGADPDGNRRRATEPGQIFACPEIGTARRYRGRARTLRRSRSTRGVAAPDWRAVRARTVPRGSARSRGSRSRCSPRTCHALHAQSARETTRGTAPRVVRSRGPGDLLRPFPIGLTTFSDRGHRYLITFDDRYRMLAPASGPMSTACENSRVSRHHNRESASRGLVGITYRRPIPRSRALPPGCWARMYPMTRIPMRPSDRRHSAREDVSAPSCDPPSSAGLVTT